MAEPDPSQAVAVSFAQIARAVGAAPTVARMLQRIVDLAVEVVDGCDEAGILLVSKGEIVTGAWSDDRVRAIEEMECRVGEGPCLDAIAQRPVFASADLRDHRAEWPTFTQNALDAGIQSMLAFRLFAADDTLGALDLYGNARGAFDETARALGTVFAAHAALALAGAQVHERDLVNIATLRQALDNRDVIGQAKGILMATRHVDSDAAFDLLRGASNALNAKLHVVAGRVVHDGALPEH